MRGDIDYTHHAPTGILTGPLEESKSKLTQPAVVLMNLRMTHQQCIIYGNGDHVRLLENVILHIPLIATILEHLLKRDNTSHTTTNRRSDFRRVHVLVQLVRIGDAGHVECL
jgi:hypothetical protein